MNVDWEVEIGGGAPVIEAHWPGFIDLRAYPERISEVAEVKLLPPLGDVLLALNSAESPVWTSKCDVWVPQPGTLGCYFDCLPWKEHVYADWKDAEAFCREIMKRILTNELPSHSVEHHGHKRAILCNESDEESVILVVRQAITEENEGFAFTVYFSASDSSSHSAGSLIGDGMAAFRNAILRGNSLMGRSQS